MCIVANAEGPRSPPATGVLRDSPARKVIHNQNPYYTFRAFPDLAAVEQWGCKAIIAGSAFGAERLKAMGWQAPIANVTPLKMLTMVR